MKWRDRVYCGSLRTSHMGKDVLLMGWVDAIRDHGNLLFIHLRDIRGIVQVVFDPDANMESYKKSTSLKEEYVVEVRGKVGRRQKGTENPNLETGDVEVFATHLEILSKAKTLPFLISEKAMVFGEEIQSSPENVDEELRLQYRYLDLRRPSVQALFIKRYEIMKCIRDYFHQVGFTEIETPFLTKSTPEGARDYLVPSRVHQDKFYALPQSPQLFKQILMMGGLDRYFQIARCFRDEDLRPNRQPEFTQLDMEAAFIDEEFIYGVIEELTVRMFALGGIVLPSPFPRMTYSEAMDRYGTECPDTRFDMSFQEVTDLVQETDYTIFRQVIEQGGKIKGFCVKGMAGKLSKNVLQNEYALRIVPSFGAKGMTWMKVIGGNLESNIVQFFSPTEQEAIRERFRAEDGDVIMIIADTSVDLVDKALGSLRLHVAERLGSIPGDRYSPLWVTDFPLFELKDGRLSSQHHPFTMPDRIDFDPANEEELLRLNSRAYDLVINGEELGGGSIRIHKMEVQDKIFKALGLNPKDVETKFGFFLRPCPWP
jgi:aspartyl-tRNA synthetase